MVKNPVSSLLDIPSSQVRPFDESEVALFIKISMDEHASPPEPFTLEGVAKTFPNGELPRSLEFPLTLFYKRLVHHCPTMPVSNGIALLMVFLAEGNPGKLVMWAYTSWLMQLHTNKLIDTELTGFVRFFPNGVPTDEQYKALWDEQKDPETGQNLLDNPETWKIA